ncbi:MAG: hypothetical protein ACYDBJ_21420 [Aggregatilineales bacterium]
MQRWEAIADVGWSVEMAGVPSGVAVTYGVIGSTLYAPSSPFSAIHPIKSIDEILIG